MYVKDVKKFIEKQKQNAQYYKREDKGWKDVEYGRCAGKISDLKCVLDREDVEVDPLQMGMRTCPVWCTFHQAHTLGGWVAIMHGTEGCAFMQKSFCEEYFIAYRDTGKLVSTRMNKVDAILGAEDKLKQAILEVDRDYHPKGIIIIKSCASAIIGDDINGVCNSLRDKVSCPLVPVDMAGGFASRHIGIGNDHVFMAWAKTIIKPPKKKIPNSVNVIADFVALHPTETRPPNDPEEIDRVLIDMGVTPHLHIPGRWSNEELATASEAALNVSLCAVSFLGYARYMEEHYGQPWVTVNRPIGITNTTQMYLAISDALGLGSKAEEVIEREIIATDKALEPYREKLRGKTFMVSLASGRMVGQVLLGLELGMKPVCLALHSLHEKVFPGLDIVDSLIKEAGIDQPEVIVEGNYYEELEAVARLKPDVWYLDGSQKAIAIRYGQPYVPCMAEQFMDPEMGYQGSITFAKNTALAVEHTDVYRRMGAPQLYLPKEPYRDFIATTLEKPEGRD